VKERRSISGKNKVPHFLLQIIPEFIKWVGIRIFYKFGDNELYTNRIATKRALQDNILHQYVAKTSSLELKGRRGFERIVIVGDVIMD
jgi:hypothetical protein